MAKRSWLWTAGLLVTLLIVAVVVMMRRGQEHGAQESVTIGAVLPLTGSAAVWGQNARMGMDLAVSEINEAGGINGRPVRIPAPRQRGVCRSHSATES